MTFGRSEPQDNIKTLPNTLAQSSSFCQSLFIQYDGLKTNLECAESSKVSSIIERLENPLMKPFLLFSSLHGSI